MALRPYRDEELNYFKFSSLVLNEFPKALRQTFRTMWDNTYGHRPGFQLWDDSLAVRNQFVSSEGGTTRVPTHHSYNEWDCTALFQATIYAQSFALPDSLGRHITLSDLYVRPCHVPHGSFHASVVSPVGNNAETFALAIDQLRLLRNSLCHSPSSEMDKITFDQRVQHAKDAFKALRVMTAVIDAVGSLTESDFPTNEVHKLEQCIRKEFQAYIKFLEVMSSDISELRALLTVIRRRVERDTSDKEDIAMLEQTIDELKTTQSEQSAQGTKILEDMSSAMDELKHKLEGETASKEDITMLEQKIDDLKVKQDVCDDESKNPGTNLKLASIRE